MRRFKLNLGVLGDKLCICDNYFEDRVEIWMMNEYGVGGSWIKQFVIRRPWSVMVETESFYFEPLKLLNSGEILLLYDNVAIVVTIPRRRLCVTLDFLGLSVQLISLKLLFM